MKIKEGVQRKADVLLTVDGNYDETGFIDIEKEAVVSLPEERYAETGEPITPLVTVTDGDEVLAEGVDYTPEYTGNTSWGYGYAKIKGIGAYTGHYNAPFYIDPKPPEHLGPSELKPGDVSGDGQVTAEDARLALRGAVGLETLA